MNELDIETSMQNGEELGFKDLQSQWVKNPDVGQETPVLTIKKIVKSSNIIAKDKEGKAFKTNLSNTEYKIDIYTNEGIYSPKSWEAWGKIKRAILESKEINGNEVVGTKFKIAHIADGMKNKDAKDAKKCYKVTLFNNDGTTKEFI